MSVVGSNFSGALMTRQMVTPARLAAACAATMIVASALGLLIYLLFAIGSISAPAPRNPFATGSAQYAPATTGLSGIVLMAQANFYAALTAAIRALKSNGNGLQSLASIGFLYGIFHAVGPGHGKGVISGYIIASRSSIWRGLALSFFAALLQAIIAVALVAVFAYVLNSSAKTINIAARNIELASFACVAGAGAILLWIKSGEFVQTLQISGNGLQSGENGAVFSFIAPSRGLHGWRVFSSIVLAAGIRPCSGAIILLVFSLSQGLFAAGVVGALAMALGTFITTGGLASLTVLARTMTQRLTSRRSMFMGDLLFSGIELLAAAFVLMVGSMLFAGIWAGGMFSGLD